VTMMAAEMSRLGERFHGDVKGGGDGHSEVPTALTGFGATMVTFGGSH
jgi:hypothetical protein